LRPTGSFKQRTGRPHNFCRRRRCTRCCGLRLARRVLLRCSPAPARRCSPRTSPTRPVCRRDGAVVDHLYRRAWRRGPTRWRCRLLVQMDRHGQAHDQSPSSLHARRFLLVAVPASGDGLRLRRDPGGSCLSERRRALAHGSFEQERCSSASLPGTERRAARRERKTKRTFAACSYPRRSRPLNCNPTAERGLGVDGISFTVHPGT
jgi:hypothetical protein